jgi:hypothetical protein
LLNGPSLDVQNYYIDVHGKLSAWTTEMAADPRPLSSALFNPPGQIYQFNPPSGERYLESWSNVFSPFPAGVFYTSAPGATFKQARWSSIALGALTGMAPNLLGNATTTSLKLNLYFAPTTIGIALAGATRATYCPVHEMMTSLTFPLGTPGTLQGKIDTITLNVYDLPLQSETPTCVVPDCTTFAGGCIQLLSPTTTVRLDTEPVLLQRTVLRWFKQVGFVPGNYPSGTLTYQVPTFKLWNPALNQSDWLPVDLLCNSVLSAVSMPALPWTGGNRTMGAQMPYAAPAGLFDCAPASGITLVDWSTATLFSEGMWRHWTGNFFSINMLALYGSTQGVTNLPRGFFDPIGVHTPAGSLAIMDASNHPVSLTVSQSSVVLTNPCTPTSTAQVMLASCDSQSTQKCDPGFVREGLLFGGAFDVYSYCSLCTQGQWCAGDYQRNLCPGGTKQPLIMQISNTSCLSCGAGQ